MSRAERHDALSGAEQCLLGRRLRKPWLLNVNFTTPHWPWEGPHDKAASDELTERMKAGPAA